MRLHPMTRSAVNSIILKHKPIAEEDYEHLEFETDEKASQGRESKTKKDAKDAEK